MNERVVAVIGVAVVLGMLVLPPVRADWAYTGNVYGGTVAVSGHDYSYVSRFHAAGQKAAIAFECLGGGDGEVDFVVCDAGDLYLLESQYGSWELQGSFTAYLQSIHFGGPVRVEKARSWEGEFQVPHTGTWFYLFSNMFALTTKTVQLAIEVYVWRDPVLGAVAGALAVFVSGAVIGVVIHHRRRRR